MAERARTRAAGFDWSVVGGEWARLLNDAETEA
jgi:hypothetical protein